MFVYGWNPPFSTNLSVCEEVKKFGFLTNCKINMSPHRNSPDLASNL